MHVIVKTEWIYASGDIVPQMFIYIIFLCVFPWLAGCVTLSLRVCGSIKLYFLVV